MKQFKSRKIKKKKNVLKYVFIFFFFFSYVFMVKFLSNHKLKKDYLSKNENMYDVNYLDVINKGINKVIKNPRYMLDRNIYLSLKKTVIVSKKEDKKTNNLYDNKKTIIYLYNTHQSEKYKDYGVYDAAVYLSNLLNKDNLYTSVEEKSMKTFLENNNLKYYNSYRASLYYLKEATKNNNNLKYFFDIHRDSVSNKISLCSYKDKNYAKVLFIIGKENSNYKQNLEETEKLNNIIKEIVPNISRGIILKEGKNVNGVYNQNVSKYVFLIEVGGEENNKEEVINTLNVLKDAIKKYIEVYNDQL